ncbi:unnamed protein product [Amoebophrya sp. A120]|nr:unnamed protein product [Amoebophrya sp. A120]|eukprot:GSA120T00009729001.1
MNRFHRLTKKIVFAECVKRILCVLPVVLTKFFLIFCVVVVLFVLLFDLRPAFQFRLLVISFTFILVHSLAMLHDVKRQHIMVSFHLVVDSFPPQKVVRWKHHTQSGCRCSCSSEVSIK